MAQRGCRVAIDSLADFECPPRQTTFESMALPGLSLQRYGAHARAVTMNSSNSYLVRLSVPPNARPADARRSNGIVSRPAGEGISCTSIGERIAPATAPALAARTLPPERSCKRRPRRCGSATSGRRVNDHGPPGDVLTTQASRQDRVLAHRLERGESQNRTAPVDRGDDVFIEKWGQPEPRPRVGEVAGALAQRRLIGAAARAIPGRANELRQRAGPHDAGGVLVLKPALQLGVVWASDFC
jgi:hypothetical protein